MAKREISSTLRNLKFMQRSAPKEEKKKTDEEPNGNFPSLGTVAKKCVVITDWDPQPGALLDHLQQSNRPVARCNKKLEKKGKVVSEDTLGCYLTTGCKKLNEEAINGRKTDASPTNSSSNGGKMSFSESKVEPSREPNGDLKRKQSEVVSEVQNRPNKSPRSSDKPSPSNKQGNGFKKPKSKKVDWSVLRPPKPQTK